jgi:DNA-binding CsgD family transcriptional regulator
MLINLDLTGEQGRVWPINVGGQHIGYLVLTLNHLLDMGVAGRADDRDERDERAPALPDAPAAELAELVEPLTAREQEVLGLIAEGLSNQAIADKLFLSLGTVKAYTSQIYGKLGVNSRTQAVAQARRLMLPVPSLGNQPWPQPSSVIVHPAVA